MRPVDKDGAPTRQGAWQRVTVLALAAALASTPASASDRSLVPNLATRQGGLRLSAGLTLGAAIDTSLTCFQDSLTLVLNPGCFDPPTVGDCRTQSEHYFVQYLTPVPNFGSPYRIKSFAFISNDASTIFPSAGILLLPVTPARFPTAQELDSLQVQNVQAAEDLGIVAVDLQQENLVVTNQMEVVICLQFPAGQQLTGIGVGPGIVVDEVNPDNLCDFFTVDGGANPATSWYSPAANDPLDWGFEVQFEILTAAESTSWSDFKRLYGDRPAVPYRNP
jgi:hypothetical protein